MGLCFNFLFSLRNVDQVTSSFPAFNLEDFQSSCLNTASSSVSTKPDEILMPSSMSMPTITPPKLTNEPKQLPVLSSTTIPPSMSFPAQLQHQQHQQQQKQIQPNLSFNKLGSTSLTSNLMNGTSSPLSNQSSQSNSNKIPMGQMVKSPQNTFASSFGNNLMGHNSNYSALNSNNLGNATGSGNKNGTSNNKSISLSAQEINDFLS